MKLSRLQQKSFNYINYEILIMKFVPIVNGNFSDIIFFKNA